MFRNLEKKSPWIRAGSIRTQEKSSVTKMRRRWNLVEGSTLKKTLICFMRWL
jgi:hypothetical protein